MAVTPGLDKHLLAVLRSQEVTDYRARVVQVLTKYQGPTDPHELGQERGKLECLAWLERLIQQQREETKDDARD